MPQRSPTTTLVSLRLRASGRRAAALAFAVALLLASCKDEPAGPKQGFTIRIASGDGQFAGFDQFLEEPLRVIVEDANTGDPRAGVQVHWSVTDGSDAQLGASTTVTDANGNASTTLQLGSSDTSYGVRATVDDLIGAAAKFVASAVAPAHIASVTPEAAGAGDTIVISGSGFAPDPAQNTVLVGGFRAQVTAASATQLRAVVPACVTTRLADVRVDRGIVQSNVLALDVTAASAAPLALDVGDVYYAASATAASCVRLEAEPDARYLVVLQNAAAVAGRPLPWRLTGASFDPAFATSPARRARPQSLAPAASRARAPASAQDRLHAALRERELRALERGAVPLSRAAARASSAREVEVGDERQFWVFRSSGDYARITAVVRYVSEHAVLYEDLDAPADGFEEGDFAQFGALFDDPIYETVTGVYGAPSDIDGNGRVIVLFTPVVNRLTAPGSSSAFVAGFFFGIDLLDDQAHGNDAEVFYTLVPDPDGEFGNVRTFEDMLRSVPPVMAHEFQHMIHFNQRVLLRDASLEITWLAEGLAHTAEELIGDEYLERGDSDRALDFRVQNFLRADIYMGSPHQFSVLGPGVPLGVRGGSWLLLEYLQGHYGGNAFLTAVTQATEPGVSNLTARTGLDWGTLLHRWGIALWADDAGVPGLDSIYEFPSIDLRQVYQSVGYPLVPNTLLWVDFGGTGELPSAGARYWILDASNLAETTRLNLAVAGRHAPYGAADQPQLSIVRIE